MSALSEYSEKIVFHPATQAHVGESWDRPYETIDTNVTGTLNLLQTVVDLDLDIEKFDTAGTSEEHRNVDAEVEGLHDYEDDGRVLLNERSPVNPKSIYAKSKLAADFLTMNYRNAHVISGVTTWMFNNHGPHKNQRYITGTVITQALERDIVELGDLQPKRDLCFATDGVRGHMHVALEGEAGEEYVYGYGENISIREWTNLILDVGVDEGYWERPEIVQREDRFRPGDSDVKELRVGYEKLHEKTGWEPQISWEEGIHRTIEWYTQNRDTWMGRSIGDDEGGRLLRRQDGDGDRRCRIPHQSSHRRVAVAFGFCRSVRAPE